MMPGNAESTASTSASVDVWPKLNRSDPRAVGAETIQRLERLVAALPGDAPATRALGDAAQRAAVVGVPIYTIAYGTPDGYIDIGGRREPVPVDRAEMARIAKISGGEAYTATFTQQLIEQSADHYKQNIGGEIKVKVDPSDPQNKVLWG